MAAAYADYNYRLSGDNRWRNGIEGRIIQIITLNPIGLYLYKTSLSSFPLSTIFFPSPRDWLSIYLSPSVPHGMWLCVFLSLWLPLSPGRRRERPASHTQLIVIADDPRCFQWCWDYYDGEMIHMCPDAVVNLTLRHRGRIWQHVVESFYFSGIVEGVLRVTCSRIVE